MRKPFIGSMLLALAVMLMPGGVMPAAEKQLKVAMILWRGETDAEKGFRDGLKELGYSVRYTTVDGKQNKTKLGQILREELQPRLREFDYVYTFGTTATRATKLILNDQVPHIFSIVVDPVGAGIVRSMNSPGSNIGGASNAISLALQIDTALKIIKFKRLGLFFNPRERNSALIREHLQGLAASRQFEVIDLRSAPATNSLEENLQKLKDKSVAIDTVYLPADNFMLSKSELIGSELRAAKIKSIAASRTYIDNGAMLGLVPDYYKLGKGAATIVDRHQKGTRLADMAIFTEKEPKIVINMTTVRALNVEIPEDVLAKATLIH